MRLTGQVYQWAQHCWAVLAKTSPGGKCFLTASSDSVACTLEEQSSRCRGQSWVAEGARVGRESHDDGVSQISCAVW